MKRQTKNAVFYPQQVIGSRIMSGLYYFNTLKAKRLQTRKSIVGLQKTLLKIHYVISQQEESHSKLINTGRLG